MDLATGASSRGLPQQMESLVMKHLIPQTMTAVLFLVLVLTLGSCGSSSDKVATELTEAEMLAAAEMAAKECTDAGGMVETDGSCTSADQIAAAVAAEAKECTDAGGVVETDGSCTSVDDRIAAAAAAEKAKACTDGGGRSEADGSCTSAADVAEEVAMACTAAGGRSNADGSCTIAASLLTEAVTAAAATKVTAIAAVQPDDSSGLGGTGGTVTSEIKYDSVKITDSANAADDDPMFEQAMDFGDGRTMHVRKMDADEDGNVVEEVVIVSTDIEPPKATPFAMVEGQMLDFDLDLTVDADSDGTAYNDFTALKVDQSMDDVLKLVKSGDFVSGPGTTTELSFAFEQEDGDTTMEGAQPVEAFETAGTYNGAMGTYRCNGTAACTVMLGAEDAITAMSAGWIFTPDAGATSDVQDADYQHYGFWLKKTTKDGATTYNEVATFADSEDDASGQNVDSVNGTASYEGGAVGVYVKNAFDPDGVIDTATSGHFKADASLMAYFGGGDVALNKQRTVTGTIDNFALAGGEENEWSVALEGRIDGGEVEEGTANGGGAVGSFSATFYGDVTPVENVYPAPSSVVGEFNANFVNGTVAGGFGAREMKEE